MQITSNSGRTISLRPPQAGDEQLLFNYAQALGAEDTFILLNPQEPVTWQEETDYLKSILNKIQANWQVHYLAFHDGTLIGSSQVSLQGRRKKHIGGFGISLLPAYRRDGIGHQLANLVIREAQKKMGVTLITLEVFANNDVAQKLYHKLGFVQYGRLPQGLRYKDQLIDSILMFKPLSSSQS